MSLKTYEKEVEHLGESQGVKDHDHEMIHDLMLYVCMTNMLPMLKDMSLLEKG